MNLISHLNLSLFYSLHNFAGKSLALDTAIIFFGHYYVFFLIGLAVFFIYRDYAHDSRERFKANLVGLILAVGGVFGILHVFRLFYHSVRPFVALDIAHLLTEPTHSFPSGHTIFIFGLATALYFYNKKAAAFLYISGVMVGIARIMGGVHYPLDIAGGIFLGILVGLAIEYVCRRCLFKSSRN